MNKVLKVVLLAVGYFGLVFFGLSLVPESINYSKEGITNSVPWVLAIGFVPTLLLILMKFTGIGSDLEGNLLMLLIVSLLVGFPAAITQDTYRLAQVEAELKAEGVVVQGVVFERGKKPGKPYTGYRITLHFLANGQEFKTFEQQDEDDLYREGDTLEVIYLERNPEISKVLVFEDAW